MDGLGTGEDAVSEAREVLLLVGLSLLTLEGVGEEGGEEGGETEGNGADLDRGLSISVTLFSSFCEEEVVDWELFVLKEGEVVVEVAGSIVGKGTLKSSGGRAVALSTIKFRSL